jgi:hypothetical protein
MYRIAEELLGMLYLQWMAVCKAIQLQIEKKTQFRLRAGGGKIVQSRKLQGVVGLRVQYRQLVANNKQRIEMHRRHVGKQRMPLFALHQHIDIDAIDQWWVQTHGDGTRHDQTVLRKRV